MTSPAKYLRPLQALLPPGPAWPRDDDAELTQLLDGLAQEFDRVDSRELALLEEIDPRTTSELLADWERVAGLSAAGKTTAQRRAALHARLLGHGDPSRALMAELAAALGYAISIREYHDPFVAGSAAGASLFQDEWSHAWHVYSSIGTDDAALQAALRAVAPAHTVPIFTSAFEASSWWQPVSGVSETLRCCATDGTAYVVVGLGPTILTSVDRDAWTPRPVGGGFAGVLLGVAYSPALALWCAVGSAGEIQTSADLVNWTSRFAAGGYAGAFYRVIPLSGGGFLASGSGGEVQTSPDGIIWTARAYASGYAGVAVGLVDTGTVVVAAGSEGEIQRSLDGGATWVQVLAAVPGSPWFRGAAWDGAQFVLIRSTGTLTSPDGATWTEHATAFGADPWGLGIDANGDLCASFADGSIYRSADGIAWEDVTPSTGGVSFRRIMGAGTGTAIAVGDNGTIWTTPERY
jgi:uncharacterized protein YmfQ (DUF2313 family)